MPTLSEALAEAVANGREEGEAKAELLADLDAGRLVGEGIPAEERQHHLTGDFEITPTSREYERIPALYWAEAISKRGSVNFEGNTILRDNIDNYGAPFGAGFIYVRIIEQKPTSRQQSINRGGRPVQKDHDRFWIEVVRIANTPDGLPDRETLTKKLWSIISDWPHPLGETEMKNKMAALYKTLGL